MSFTAIFVMIFLIAFALIGGVVMFLSKTIDHGEAQFGPDGKVISGSKPSDKETNDE
jgi:preprotein translocase subunit SecG